MSNQSSSLKKGLIFNCGLSEWNYKNGAELVTAQNDRDFSSGTIGNWVVATDGNGTCTYDGTNPSGEKVGKILVGTTAGTYTYGRLSTANLTSFAANKKYILSARVYIVSGGSFTVVTLTTAALTDAATILNISADLTKTNAWQGISIEFTTGTDVIGYMVVASVGGSDGDILYFDNVSIREVNTYVVDEVTKSLGTVTSVIPVLGKGGEGRRSLEFDGVNDYVTLPTIPAFGTGDFSILIKFNPASLSFDGFILGGNSGSLAIRVTNGSVILFKVGIGELYTCSISSILAENTLSYTRSGTTGTVVLNGVSETFEDATNYTGIQTVLGYYGLSGIVYYRGSISMCRIFNYALTPTQVVNYSKPEYPIEWVDRGYGGVLTSGTLVTGKIYKIIDWITNDDFTNIGGTNADGTVFTATGTTPTTWTNSSTVVLLGTVLDLNAEGMGSTYWYDKTNSLTATISGASYIKPVASNLGASYFNGSTSVIDFSASPDINNCYSISIWANCNKIILSSTAFGGLLMSPKTDYYIILGSFTGTLSNELITIGLASGSVAYSYYAEVGGSIPIGWHHYCFVWDGSKYQIYYDGIAKTTSTYGTPLLLNAAELIIGFPNTSGINGNEKDVRFYNRSLTQQEITNLANGIK